VRAHNKKGHARKKIASLEKEVRSSIIRFCEEVVSKLIANTEADSTKPNSSAREGQKDLEY
jgi:hypothetical protein